MEVFAEKMLVACQALLGVVAELKRNALLNDVAGRNEEVRTCSCSSLHTCSNRQHLLLSVSRFD